MAAGTSSRFVPLCWERPKGLLEVKGEILIERQIKQLKAAGVEEIAIVTGYMADQFEYLKDKFGVSLAFNPDYARYNNTSTLMCVLDKLDDTWICSSDNYFTENVFDEHPVCSQYSAEYADGKTDEYCLICDKDKNIINVTVGGANAWYMIGHVYFSKDFSVAFKKILVEEYKNEETRQGYWEDVYIKHLKELPLMKIRKFEPGIINEFDSLEDLRTFDKSYIENTRSNVVKQICRKLCCKQDDIYDIRKYKDLKHAFLFRFKNKKYVFKSTNLADYFEITEEHVKGQNEFIQRIIERLKAAYQHFENPFEVVGTDIDSSLTDIDSFDNEDVKKAVNYYGYDYIPKGNNSNKWIFSKKPGSTWPTIDYLKFN